VVAREQRKHPQRADHLTGLARTDRSEAHLKVANQLGGGRLPHDRDERPERGIGDDPHEQLLALGGHGLDDKAVGLQS
jgi:hypothetical protein